MTLRVKVEIVPFGDEAKAYEIGRLDIFNKGHADFGHCEYGVILIEPEKNEAGLLEKTILHRRSLGSWKLIEKVLKELINKE